jgi:penicillin-binding protein 1A
MLGGNMSAKRKRKFSIMRFLGSMLTLLIILGLVGSLIGAGVVYVMVKNTLADIKNIDPSNIESLWEQNSIIYDDKGVEIEKVESGGLRTVIKYDEMSEDLINAYVAVEDKTFWEHNGFNFVRLIGAFVDTITTGKPVAGTSTITQQLARNLYLAEIKSERSLERKIKEAYYAIELEKSLEKYQIIEAYLNTIYLGTGANGVEAASQTYFSKSAKEIDLVEAAILAGIPKSPTDYSPTKKILNIDVSEEDVVLDQSDEQYTVIYNPLAAQRYQTVIRLMFENGKINETEYNKAKETDILTRLNPSVTNNAQISSYFADMVKNDVIDDLMEKYDYSKTEATNVLYKGGLKIYSTIDTTIQKKIDDVFNGKDTSEVYNAETVAAVKAFQQKYNLSVDGTVGQNTWNKLVELNLVKAQDYDGTLLQNGVTNPSVVLLKAALDSEGLFHPNSGFPKVTVFLDSNKNIINGETKEILLYNKTNLIDQYNNLVIGKGEYKYDDNGNLILLKGKRFIFRKIKDSNGVEQLKIEIKNSFTYDSEDKSITRNKEGSINIPSIFIYQGYEVVVNKTSISLDDKGNLIIAKNYIDKSNLFIPGQDETLLVTDSNYTYSTKGVVQPQAAMTVIDYTTGQLKAISGGRNLTGQKIYNRALNPRQPGSAIKPLSIYLPAIDTKKFTAASVIDDVPTYLKEDPTVRWPYNWYEDGDYQYYGIQTVREAIMSSINVIAAKVGIELGTKTSLEYLHKFGFTTLVDEGPVNDANISAMALGGMTKGLTPLEIASAYGAIANDGTKVETVTYTKVLDSKGNILLESNPELTKIVDPQVAFIVEDMMVSNVTSGISKTAAIKPNNKGIPVSGKTGTTSNKNDAWFVGYTPYYVASLWFGNDLAVPLNQGSVIAAQYWKKAMSLIHEDLEDKNFDIPQGLLKINVDTKSGKLPSELSSLDPRGTIKAEYFLPGTEPKNIDDVHILVNIDKTTNLLATEFCPVENVVQEVRTRRLDTSFVDKIVEGEVLSIKDQDYSVPLKSCDVHIGPIEGTEVIDVTNPDTPDSIENKIMDMPDGSRLVVIESYVKTKTNDDFILPVQTKILQDGTIVLPDNTMLYPIDYFADSFH